MPQPPPNGGGKIRLGPGVFVADSDLDFSATRSSGPGGQNVNKRSTRVELRVPISAIPLNAAAERRLRKLAGSWLVGDGELLISSQDERSQKRNKDACVAKLKELVIRALTKPKPRIRTKPTRGSIERRLQSKRETADKKRRRQSPPRAD
jgi:ribosome-associated protein